MILYHKSSLRCSGIVGLRAVLPEPDYRAGATEDGDGALAGGIDAAHDKAREIPATVKQPTRAGSDELWENLRTAAFAD